MGNEASSSMQYPGQHSAPTNPQRTTTSQSSSSRSTTNSRKPKTQLVPQRVALVGYTAEGAPIFTTVDPQAALASTIASPSVPLPASVASTTQSIAETQQTIQPLPTYSQQSNPQNTYTNTNKAVLAVPRTVLGPDGKLQTVLVVPTFSTDVGAQVIETGIISTGGSYQLVREPNGRIVRHVYHAPGVQPPPDAKTTSYIHSNSAYATNNPKYTYNHSSRTNQTNRTHTRPTQTAHHSYQNTSSSRPIAPSSSYNTSKSSRNSPYSPSTSTSIDSASASMKQSEPPNPKIFDPAVLDTADFLRSNTSLDTSYCPPKHAESSSSQPLPGLPNNQTLESKTNSDNKVSIAPVIDDNRISNSKDKYISEVSSSNHEAQTANPRNEPVRVNLIDGSPLINYPSTAQQPKPETSNSDNSYNSTKVDEGKELPPAYKPSKALKSLYAQGGDKGLIEVYNPYDEL